MSHQLPSALRSANSRSAVQKPVSSNRWWKRGFFAAGGVAAIAAVISVLSGAASRDDKGGQLTYTIQHADLLVLVTEQGTLESSNNTEIKCKVRGVSTVLWVIEPGTEVKPGDELVRLDTSIIEDNINAQKIIYERARATFTQSETDVAVAQIAISEYEDGIFRSEMQSLEKDLAIAESNLRSANNLLEHTERMFKRGYVSRLDVEMNQFAVRQAELELELKQTEIDVLDRFTRAKTLEELRSALTAAQARMAADQAAMDLELARLQREEVQLENCVILAETGGMVIYPSAAQWKETPDIEEGANVREDQVLLMIPDLSQMQVKVGIHESKVDRVRPGMPARVVLQDMEIDGQVSSVASITRPAGWWTGNVVEYDTIIQLDSLAGLKPGMSAEVEVMLARHEDVLTIPVAAVVEHGDDYYCWVATPSGNERRTLKLGDSNDQFIVVEAGLKAGDEVVLNPIAHIDEAQANALRPVDGGSVGDRNPDLFRGIGPGAGESAVESESETLRIDSAGEQAIEQADASTTVTGAQIVQLTDKNGDGVLTIDEFAEDQRSNFEQIDLNQDGQVDAGEIDTAMENLK